MHVQSEQANLGRYFLPKLGFLRREITITTENVVPDYFVRTAHVNLERNFTHMN